MEVFVFFVIDMFVHQLIVDTYWNAYELMCPIDMQMVDFDCLVLMFMTNAAFPMMLLMVLIIILVSTAH